MFGRRTFDKTVSSKPLALAAERQRALVSHDVGTMPAHFRAFTNVGRLSSAVKRPAQGVDLASAAVSASSRKVDF